MAIHDGGSAPKPPLRAVHDGGSAPKPPLRAVHDGGSAPKPPLRAVHDGGSAPKPPLRADPLRHLEAELEALRERGLLRTPPDTTRAGQLDLCSNDYLGYASDAAGALARERSGAGASRLVSGNDRAHEEAEDTL